MGLVFKAEVKKLFNIERRYKLGVISDFIVYYILFMLFYLFTISNIGESIPKDELNLKISIQVVSYIAWYFFSLTINFIFNTISNESKEGTLEQLCIGSNSLNKIFFVRLLVVSLRNIVLMVPLVILINISTSTKIIINWYTVLIFFLIILGTAGLSLLLGGLQIYYKNIGQFPFIMTILFLGSVFFDMSLLPSSVQKILSFLPFAKSVDLIKLSIMPHMVITSSELILLSMNSLVYLFIGIYIFHYFVNKAKELGRLGSF